MHAPNPQPEAAVCAVTRGNIRKLAATAFIALIVVFAVASNNGIKDETEAAYRRGVLFNKRRKLMEAWAGYCAAPKAGKVVAFRQGAH